MRKKWTYVAIVSMMLGVAPVFTGCVDTDEPAGLSELRGAKKEAEILKKLHHPNIIQYLNSFVGSTKKDFRIVLEYADAKDLKHYIERNSPVKEAKILEIFAQIMLGIQYIHSPSIHILHRDIKIKRGLVADHIVVTDSEYLCEVSDKPDYCPVTYCHCLRRSGGSRCKQSV